MTNCITGNPLFTNLSDGDGADNKWATADDGITIQNASPAKNYGVTGAGVPNLDIVGTTRDAQPDLGAYEYVVACVNPTAYAISGGGSYCAGGVGHVVILLDSETGVTYQLKNGASNVGSPVSGSGNSISFGNQTAAGTYTIVATRTVGGCSTTMTGSVTITVTPNVTPTFTAVSPICSGATLSALPTTSNNSITGTWSPALNNTQTTTYTFTPTVGQCATTTTLTITVNPNVTPTFTAVSPICSGDTLSALPTTSNNSITGTWSPSLNNTETTTYTFTPTAGQCATTTTLTITVNPNVTPTFTAVIPICSGATLSALPTTSNNSITGTWSPALNNTQTTTYTFTPTAGQCATTTTLTITVNPNVTPTFMSVGPICSGNTLSALPTTSTNSITGAWSPALNNTQTTTYTFTPTAGQCATASTLTITVNITPTPIGDSVQTFSVEDLNEATVEDLVVSPLGVIWYGSLSDALSASNALSPTTVLINGNNYYAVSIQEDCASAPLEVTVSVTLGNEHFERSIFSVSPNPTTGMLNILGNSTIREIVVINMLGQIVQHKNANSNTVTLDLSSLPNAIFFIKISGDSITKTFKIIKE
ncbi:MAG: T9SS type A sorting domain-containing protein [Flavobacterium sp. JAD_PAG50586_2]|nr:MAG: T9SS type A sorting domain-containing protein [Flavobacterium sp. JAD_PAG50586_2]